MSYIVLYCIVSCIAQLSLIFLVTVQTGLLTLIAASLNFVFYLLSVRRFWISISFFINCLLNSIIDWRHVCRSKTLWPKTQHTNFFSRHFVFNFIASKLYTISLLSSLNSRQGWGYDTSEEFDLRTDLGLRFASNSQSTDDRTSVITTTPPVSPHSPYYWDSLTHQDFISGATNRRTILAMTWRPL